MPEAAPPLSPEAERRAGVWLSVGAYTLWGAFPIYFKALHAAPLEVLANRVVWSALFLVAIAAASGWLPRLLERVRSPRVLFGSFLSAALLAVNWFVYIWAVAHDRVVDASLGYFMTPLVSVALGVFFFREMLRTAQRLAIATATLGVAWLTLQFGQLPWVALTLAFSFGSYAALRKRAMLDAFEGLLLEQVLMLPFAAFFVAGLATQGQSWFQLGSSGQALLLVLTGPLSAGPLLMFAAGARKIPLSLLGVLQYISPTLQLMCGVLLWHEPFSGAKLVGYVLIWLALVIYTLEGAWAAKLRRREQRSAQPG